MGRSGGRQNRVSSMGLLTRRKKIEIIEAEHDPRIDPSLSALEKIELDTKLQIQGVNDEELAAFIISNKNFLQNAGITGLGYYISNGFITSECETVPYLSSPEIMDTRALLTRLVELECAAEELASRDKFKGSEKEDSTRWALRRIAKEIRDDVSQRVRQSVENEDRLFDRILNGGFSEIEKEVREEVDQMSIRELENVIGVMNYYYAQHYSQRHLYVLGYMGGGYEKNEPGELDDIKNTIRAKAALEALIEREDELLEYNKEKFAGSNPWLDSRSETDVRRCQEMLEIIDDHYESVKQRTNSFEAESKKLIEAVRNPDSHYDKNDGIEISKALGPLSDKEIVALNYALHKRLSKGISVPSNKDEGVLAVAGVSDLDNGDRVVSLVSGATNIMATSLVMREGAVIGTLSNIDGNPPKKTNQKYKDSVHEEFMRVVRGEKGAGVRQTEEGGWLGKENRLKKKHNPLTRQD